MVEPRPFEPIQPTTIDLTRYNQGDDGRPAGAKDKPRVSTRSWILWALGIVLTAGLLVVFLAPQLIVPTRAPLSPPTTASPPAATPAPALPSPYEEAQLAEARRNAQDLLAQILTKQQALESKQVQLWGADGFAAATALAGQGDNLYRQRDFHQALALYQQALDALTSLESQRDEVIASTLDLGQQALARGSEEDASAAFGKVLAIDPDNKAAARGLKQAQLLPQTRPLMAQAREALSAGELVQAEQLFNEVIALDPDHREAKSALQIVREQLLEQRFNSAMSSGLAALRENRLDSAKAAFGKALALRPGHPDARASLDQANARQAAQTVSSQLQTAAALEAKEQWQEAASLYETILASDDSVVQARVGQIRSQARARLDSGIDAIIADPLRLSSPSVLREGQQLLADARAIAEPGPRLQNRITALADAIAQSQIPVAVTLESDNLTLVTVLRVGEMGTFASRQLSLKPGNYVALGSRDGYRDVRVEFRVSSESRGSNESPDPIVVICREAV